MTTPTRYPEMSAFADQVERLVANVARVIRGNPELVRSAVACLLAEGHLLIEDVPGVGKTSLARALAASLKMTWNRVQFTPDLLPSDITGVSVYEQKTGQFNFRPGPVFANLVIADEINRASPKTQSALLEVMEERTVTTDATVYPVARPFIVVATQNPIDLEGTYQLPEAQLDRFLMRLKVGYPSVEDEAQVFRAERNEATVTKLAPIMRADELTAMIDYLKANVDVAQVIDIYVAKICAATREHPDVRLGVSPRGGLALLRAARASAGASGRPYVTPADIQSMAEATLTHRIILKPEAEVQGKKASDVVLRALKEVPAPRAVSG